MRLTFWFLGVATGIAVGGIGMLVLSRGFGSPDASAGVCYDSTAVITEAAGRMSCTHRDHTMVDKAIGYGRLHVSCVCPWHAPSTLDPWSEERAAGTLPIEIPDEDAGALPGPRVDDDAGAP